MPKKYDFKIKVSSRRVCRFCVRVLKKNRAIYYTQLQDPYVHGHQ